jgi:cytochrome c peroxidase
MSRRLFSRPVLGLSLVVVALAGVAAARLQGDEPQPTLVPNGRTFANPGGASRTFSTLNGGIDLTNPFFKDLGSNGRSCATCHEPGDGMSVSAAHVQDRFSETRGRDPIFRTNDGSNCDHDIDVSTLEGRRHAYSLLRTRGLIRVALAVPGNADYQVTNVDNPYGCSEHSMISMYRRPLPSTNLRFLSTVMWDGRESSVATGTLKILPSNYPSSLLADLAHQSLDATKGHAQGDGTRPTAAEQQQIVNFEMALTTAQVVAREGGQLTALGATGGPFPLTTQPFFVSINSSVHPLVPAFEQPGGLVTPGDGIFTPEIFDTFTAWTDTRRGDARAAIARGQALFNSKPITITEVAGINDDVSAGGLVVGGVPSLTGTCGTCHDTPNVGNHSFATPLNIGTGDPSDTNPSVNLGGLDVAFLPRITVCRTDSGTGQPSPECKTTTDLGQALVDGKFDHVGKIKGPILRGLSTRAPYFHNGAAQNLTDVLRFYEKRFNLVLTPQEESDLVAFLAAL